MQDNERSPADSVVSLSESKQRKALTYNETSLRRLALQLAVQLPDDPLHAQKVIGYLAKLQNEFIDRS